MEDPSETGQGESAHRRGKRSRRRRAHHNPVFTDAHARRPVSKLTSVNPPLTPACRCSSREPPGKPGFFQQRNSVQSRVMGSSIGLARRPMCAGGRRQCMLSGSAAR
eukprot:3095957-Pyramimonas_sp.AAC.1